MGWHEGGSWVIRTPPPPPSPSSLSAVLPHKLPARSGQFLLSLSSTRTDNCVFFSSTSLALSLEPDAWKVCNKYFLG